MEVVHERCCGLDVHKKIVVACLLTPGGTTRRTTEVRTFGTMTRDLLHLADWLAAAGCTHVAMESTGSYWKPVYNILEATCTVLVVNAQHMKAVPGRKTDVKDAEWIADLLQHGLLRPSFIPDRAGRDLRELTRYRMSLVRERTAEVNRIQKVLEGANIKLASVASNIVGVSGRAMLTAMIAGVAEPAVLADFARGRLREKRDLLEGALEGRMNQHQRFLLNVQLHHLDDLDATIAQVSEEIELRQRPFTEAAVRLMTIPGVGPRTAQTILAEVGPDMSRFPSAGHLSSWAGLCPGHHESAGKRTSGRTRKGSPWLRGALVEAAQSAGRSKTHLGEHYHRIAARRGKKRAAVATAHTILVAVYYILGREQVFEDLGVNYFDERRSQRTTRRLVRRLESLGYTVSIESAA
jgi:transposase